MKGGKESPYRNRPVEENLDLFRRMKAGEFPDGSRTLRAKIDMDSPNFNLRDPVLYRILHAEHPHAGDNWCIYPMYDWAHGQSDSIEGITHSICTLEFENHRPLYDWCVEALGIYHPQQIEFARLNLTYTVMSKRRLIELVTGGFVNGWDDPRMPTIAASAAAATRRRRSATSARRSASPSSTASSTWPGWRTACATISTAAPCACWPCCGRSRWSSTIIPKARPRSWTRSTIPKTPAPARAKSRSARVLYIEQDDFREDPPKEFFRLAPGREVRLRYAYFIKCVGVEEGRHDRRGRSNCTAPTTRPRRGGNAPDSRKVKGTIHWVSAEHAVDGRGALVR